MSEKKSLKIQNPQHIGMFNLPMNVTCTRNMGRSQTKPKMTIQNPEHIGMFNLPMNVTGTRNMGRKKGGLKKDKKSSMKKSTKSKKRITKK